MCAVINSEDDDFFEIGETDYEAKTGTKIVGSCKVCGGNVIKKAFRQFGQSEYGDRLRSWIKSEFYCEDCHILYHDSIEEEKPDEGEEES